MRSIAIVHPTLLRLSFISALGAIFAACASCILLLLWKIQQERKNHIKFPLLGHKQSADLKEIVESQWIQDKEKKYVLQLPIRPIHVLPTHYVNDYAWKPEHQISSNIDLRERLLGSWTRIGSMTPEAPGDPTHSLISFIKQDLTKNAGAFVPSVHEEVMATIDEQIGDCPDWKPLSAYWLSLNFTLRIFEHVYVGLDLCRSKKWNEACMGYSSSAVATVAALMRYPWWMRPFVAPFLRGIKDLKRNMDVLENLLNPIVKTRLKSMKESADFQRPNDFIQWWIEKVDQKREDTYAMTASLIGLNFAGIRSTGVVLMQALFDLASRSEYIAPLREELERVMAEEGGENLSPRAMAKLPLMDSFLKESQRHVAQNILSVYRKVMAPLTLKDGTILPTGSYVCIPSMDPEVDPKSLHRDFDGFRWARLRKETGRDGKYLSVATGPDSLEFGYGSHACPGRFFAVNVLKAIVARLLLKYDLKLRDGDTANAQPKYNRILVLMPDTERVVEFRRRGREEGGGERDKEKEEEKKTSEVGCKTEGF